MTPGYYILLLPSKTYIKYLFANRNLNGIPLAETIPYENL